MLSLSTLYKKTYAQTPFFSKIVNDFLNEEEHLRVLRGYDSKTSIEEIIAHRKNYPVDRLALKSILTRQNKDYLTRYPQVASQIASLQLENTFTVCTAHQPHIALGPLYVVYKTIHAILLARHLSEQYPQYSFVPIFFIGSEDADKSELLELFVQDKRYFYQTPQRGAVGRMHTQEWGHFYERIDSSLRHLPYQQELGGILKEAYDYPCFTDAFRHILYELFGKKGLVIVDIDDADIKKMAMPLFEKEIKDQFSFPLLQKTNQYIDSLYGKHQLDGSDINLFHLENHGRSKMRTIGNAYMHPTSAQALSKEDYLHYVHTHPTTVSPNAVLRPLVQELILPNVAFIGGGGEIAYWLQLRRIFDEASIHFPLLQLRHSFTLFTEQHMRTLQMLDISAEQFMDAYPFEWRNFLPEATTYLEQSEQFRFQIFQSMEQYHRYIQSKGVNDLHSLGAFLHHANEFYLKKEKKMIRHLKKERQIDSISSLHDRIFPFGKLQERTNSFVEWYAMYGQPWVDALLEYPLTTSSTHFSGLLLNSTV